MEGTYEVTYQAERTRGTVGAQTLQCTFTITIVGLNTLNQPDITYNAMTTIRDVRLARVQQRDDSVSYTYHLEDLPSPLDYFADGHRLFPGRRGAQFQTENLEGFDVVLVATPDSRLFSVLRAPFKIFVGPRATGTLIQEDMRFFQNRAYPLQPFARVENGPAGSQYEYRISGTAPTGMRIIPTGISGRPTVVQSVDLTLTATVITTGDSTPDPNSPYSTTFSVIILDDPTIAGVTLSCLFKEPVDFDARGRPIYEYFVNERPQLYWETRNLNIRQNIGCLLYTSPSPRD